MRYSYKSQRRRGIAYISCKNITNGMSSKNMLKTPDLVDYDLSDPLWYHKYADDMRRMNAMTEEWRDDGE